MTESTIYSSRSRSAVVCASVFEPINGVTLLEWSVEMTFVTTCRQLISFFDCFITSYGPRSFRDSLLDRRDCGVSNGFHRIKSPGWYMLCELDGVLDWRLLRSDSWYKLVIDRTIARLRSRAVTRSQYLCPGRSGGGSLNRAWSRVPNLSSTGDRPPISVFGIVISAWLSRGRTVSDAHWFVSLSSCTRRRRCPMNRAFTCSVPLDSWRPTRDIRCGTPIQRLRWFSISAVNALPGSEYRES